MYCAASAAKPKAKSELLTIFWLKHLLLGYNGGLSVRPWNSSLFLDPVLGFQTLTENTCPMHNGTPNPKSSAFDFAFAAALGGNGRPLPQDKTCAGSSKL